MRILGIDPGSRATGYGIVRREGSTLRRIAGGVIRAHGDSASERLAQIQAQLCAVIEAHLPEVAALESVFTARNPRSALLLGQARGVALAVCGSAGLVTAEYAPAEIKVAVVGYGRAEKLQVQGMVQRLLGLSALPQSDEADALAVAICHGARSGGAARIRASRELARRTRA